MPTDAASEAAKKRRKTRRNRYMREVYRKSRKTLNVMLLPDPYARLRKNARAAGITPTELMRSAAFAYFDLRFLLPKNLEAALHGLTRQLRAAGNSLNQVAHRANMTKAADNEDLRECLELLRNMERSVTRFVTEPPRAD